MSNLANPSNPSNPNPPNPSNPNPSNPSHLSNPSSLTRKRPLWVWAPVVVYMGFIFVLSSVSKTPEFVSHVDKYLHATLYAGLGALVVRALAGGWIRRVTLAMVFAAVVIGAAYGVSDEFHQSFVPGRNVEAADVIADTIGTAIAAVALYGWDIIRARHAL